MFDAASWIQDRFFTLTHEYDPVKAHEYYMRTRKLKGRRSGYSKAPTPTRPRRETASEKPASTKDYRQGLERQQKPQKSNAEALREAASKRQVMLRARLERLEVILAQLTEQARAAAGVETKAPESSSKTKESSTKSTEKDKPKTASEKKEAAKKARENYEENKKPETTESAQDIQDKIEDVQAKIAQVRETLRRAIEKARSQQASSSKDQKPTNPRERSGTAPVKGSEKSTPRSSGSSGRKVRDSKSTKTV